MFSRILIANRGEIACRVIKTARRMGIGTVAVFSDADRNALHVEMADEAVHIGPAPAGQSYLAIDSILRAVRETGSQAVHPGYGFLSERPGFARALEEAGVAFIGPPADAIEAMGDKITSKKLAAEAGVSTVPGYMGLIADADEAVRIARDIGYPVMIKASAGGGGKGMRVAWNDRQTREGFQSSRNEAASSFGDDRIFIEKFVTSPRHIEIQVLGDAHGTCLWLGERECSIQRRNQKVIEEAPSPFLDAETRRAMGEQATALARAVGYRSAGTVEFIVDADRSFYFLEMNTRLQVEHPVTELVTGIDLVEQMIRVAAGERLALSQEDVKLDGWAVESRIYAEDPYRGFLPSTGRLTRYAPPASAEGGEPGERRAGAGGIIRNDTGVYEGGEISIFYDPMIAKLCTWGSDRGQAIALMRRALDRFQIEGIRHNIPFLQAVMDRARFVAGELTTAFIDEEFPDGFSGVELPEETVRRIALVAAAMHWRHEMRDARISGRMANHERVVPDRWNVRIGEREFPVRVHLGAKGVDDPGGGRPPIRVGETAGDAQDVDIHLDYSPGAPLAVAGFDRPVEDPLADDDALVLKVARATHGFHISYRGADLDALVRTPRAAELAARMPEKAEADTSKLLLCPMPGVVVSIAVEEGQEVGAGETLAVVEAMKMENVLRAERDVVVAKVHAAAGQNLSVDEAIMEFE